MMYRKQLNGKCRLGKTLASSMFINVLWVSFFYLLLPLQYGLAGNIIDTNDYSYWRELASHSEMYQEMKASAVYNAQSRGRTLDIMGANALAYILDPSNKPIYVNNIKKGFETNVNRIVIGTVSGDGKTNYPYHNNLPLIENSIYYTLNRKKMFVPGTGIGTDLVTGKKATPGKDAIKLLHCDPMFDEGAIKQRIFHFKEGSPAIALGIQPIDLSTVGSTLAE